MMRYTTGGLPTVRSLLVVWRTFVMYERLQEKEGKERLKITSLTHTPTHIKRIMRRYSTGGWKEETQGWRIRRKRAF